MKIGMNKFSREFTSHIQKLNRFCVLILVIWNKRFSKPGFTCTELALNGINDGWFSMCHREGILMTSSLFFTVITAMCRELIMWVTAFLLVVPLPST